MNDCQHEMNKVRVAGITFGKSNNRENLRDTVSGTQRLLEENGFETSTRIVSFQNNKSLISFNYKKHDKIRKKYGRLLLDEFFLNSNSSVVARINTGLRNYIKRNREITRRSGSKYAWKQLNLTGKHMFLWQDFLESDFDYLIVFEDDISCNPNSELNLDTVLRYISTFENQPIFVNLIHQFNLRNQEIHLEYEKPSEHFYFTKVFANTTGAYIINRQMAQYLFEAILVEPNLRVMGADWLIGLLARKIPIGNKSICLNVEPTMYYNDSLDDSNSTLEN
jgi:hypothetical protein